MSDRNYDTGRENKNSGLQGTNKFRLVFGIMMVIIYLCMALLIIFSELFDINEVLRYIIGILFFVYGIFRGIRLWKNGI